MKCLEKASINARYIKSKGFDWSYIGGLYDIYMSNTQLYKYSDDYCKAFLEAYRSYNGTIWEGVYNNLFMEYLIDASGGNVSILDVGSGTSAHFRGMCKGLDISRVSKYTTIDKKPSSDIHGDLFAQYPDIRGRHTHIQKDVFDIKDELPVDTYDIVIIDIEPHSKEIDVYNIIYPYVKTEHIVICKCIGFIDLYSSSLANHLLNHMLDKGILHSFFGISCESLTRDVTIIVNKNKTEYKGSIFPCLEDKYVRYRGEPTNFIPLMMNNNAVHEHLLSIHV